MPFCEKKVYNVTMYPFVERHAHLDTGIKLKSFITIMMQEILLSTHKPLNDDKICSCGSIIAMCYYLFMRITLLGRYKYDKWRHDSIGALRMNIYL